MIRFFDAVTIAATIVVAVGLYAVKYDTVDEAQHIERLNAAIAAEENAIGVLRAEWSLLNQPDRLQELADRHLDLKPIEADQIVGLAGVPERNPQEAMDALVRRAIAARRAPAMTE